MSLARMLRLKRPDLTVLIVGQPTFKGLAEGLGTFIPSSIDLAGLVAATRTALDAGEDTMPSQDRQAAD